jgi:hypothetical protein
MECCPVARETVLKAAEPLESSVSAPSDVAPSKKLTPPMGDPLPLAPFAVTVSTDPSVMLAADTVIVRVVATDVTVTGTEVDVLA